MADRQTRNLAARRLADRVASENIPIPEFLEHLARALERQREALGVHPDDRAALAGDALLLRRIAKEHQKEFS